MKAMHTAKGGDGLRPRAKHQVIGIGEDYLCTGGAKLVGRYAFDAGGCSDRHENRRSDLAVRCGKSPCAGLAFCVVNVQ